MLACSRSYGLPYRYADCDLERSVRLAYLAVERKSDGVMLKGSCEIVGSNRKATPGSIEYFMFERYSLYTLHQGSCT